MRLFKKRVSLLIVFIVVFILSAPTAWAETDSKKYNYLALGDSLAAGMLHDRTIGDGYADFIATQLEQLGLLDNFNKDFAKPGHTTAGVLADMTDNKEIDGVSIQSAITEADLITISVGVNDMLRQLDRDNFTYDQAEMSAALELVKQNIETIVTKIKAVNPDVKVYVMGYYNAFPYLPTDVQGNVIIPLLSFLNDDIKQASERVGAKFVRTDLEFEKGFEVYLPNKANIHPGEKGYLAIANCFWKAMDLGHEVEFTDDIPDWAEDDVHYLVRKGLVKGHEDGTFRARNLVTRIHAAYVINRAVIFESNEGTNPGYHDMTADSEGFDIVAKLTQYGVFEGDNKRNFNPHKPLTRGQMAKIMVQAFQIKGESSTVFEDVKGHWAEHDIQKLMTTGAVSGYPNRTFKPDQYMTRAEFAKILSFIIRPDFHESQS